MSTAPARKPTVHMIGNAHIDHAWLWRWPEARKEVVATVRSALDRMREYPEFVFSFSSAVSYEWLEADAPELFAEVVERIAQGRWNVVGGWYVQPDCNVPSGEAIVRQILYGKRYFQERLGLDVQVGYNVDTFGHAGTLPQLLAKAGQPYYVFFRPGPHEMALPPVFWWRAPDGSRVLACRPPHHYGTGDVDLADRIARASEQVPDGLDDVMCFYGVGNHGGGPTIRNIESILAVQRAVPGFDVVFSTPDAFFAAALATTTEYPTVAAELQHHSRGCYSVVSEIKRANRHAEHALGTAERLATVASAVFGEPYPAADLTEGWKLTLFNQFHDILAGTCIPEVYDDCREDYRRVSALAGAARDRALEAIGRRIDTRAARGQGHPVLLFNPLPWARTDPTHFSMDTTLAQGNLLSQNRRPGDVRLVDASGAPLPCQVTRVEHHGGGYRVHLAADVPLPGLGYRLCRLELLPAGEPAPITAPLKEAAILENEHLRVTIDLCTGWLTSLRDKALGVELLSGPGAVPIVIDDPSDTWSHGVASFREKLSHFIADHDVRLVERGPVRSVVRVRARRDGSTVQQDFILYAGARQLDVEVRVDWHGQWQALKLAFPFALADPRATYDAPYGHVVRPTDGEEEPGQQWVDVTGHATTRTGTLLAGVSLLNDGKYGFDVLEGELRMTVLRSPAYAFHSPRQVEPDVEYTFVDQGEQRFRYALVPHDGDWADAGVPRRAWELNVPALARFEPEHAGELPAALGFLEVAPRGVVASALKVAEDGRGQVLRLIETAGRPTLARLAFAHFGVDGPVEVELGPYEVKTLRLLDGRAIEVDLLERPVGQP